MSNSVTHLRSRQLSAIATCTLVLSTAAYAQEPGKSGSGLEEIVVTAQRRAENQQEVPIAVTTLTAAEIEGAGVTGTDNLRAVTPGLMFTTQQRSSQVFIRGVGSQSTGAGDEGAVATYIDGVYYPSSWGNVISFNNIERVEVLKGPQGTLFGRNATGGLIHVITREPQADFSSRVGVSYDNFDTVEGTLYATGGGEQIAADIAAYGVHQGEGWGDDLTNGGDVNRKREQAVRSKIAWTPTDDDRLTLALDYSMNESDIGLIRTPIPGHVAVGGVTNPGSIYDFIGNFRRFDDTEIEAYGGALKYERDLGGSSLSILTAYRKEDSAYKFDSDGTVATLVHSDLHEETESVQTEVLLTGSAQKLDWTGGVFLFNADSRFNLTQGSVLPSLQWEGVRKQDTHSIAGFAQGTYSFTDTTRLTLGARYTRDKRNHSARDVALPGLVVAGTPVPAGTAFFTKQDDKTWGEWTYRVALDQKLTESVMVYASYNRGFKSGVYNLSTPNQPVVDPETIDAYEVGLKSEWFDHLLRFNLAAYKYDYKDIQLQQVAVGGALLFNAAEGDVKGVDVELQLAPKLDVGELTVSAGASFLDATYDSFPGAPISTPGPTGGNITTSGDAKGNDMTRSPPVTGNLAVDYFLPVAAGELGFNVNYYYNDGFYFEPDNRVKQDSYSIVNAQVAYSFGPDQRYRVRVFGKNLGDEEYFNSITEFAFGDQAVPGQPRTYGVGIDVNFD
ncbi:MAG: TonB-dependent receptor [Steroidobacteraceae bacterium]